MNDWILLLSEAIKTMDVPPERIDDLKWLQSNLSVKNLNHPNYNVVMTIISEQLNKQQEGRG